jgi:phenylalanyl-tRNA synthetase beta chain
MVLPGAEYASRLILECCGGEASRVFMAGSPETEPRRFGLRPGRVKALGGIDVAAAEQRRILADLGFAVDATVEPWRVVAPSWRGDVGGEADLVEEITRIVGYDAIPSVPLPRTPGVARPVLTAAQRRVPMAKRTLAARGFTECVTWSFLPRRQAELFGGGKPELMLANPISSELDAMRPSLLPNLLAAVGRNLDRGFAELRLFEVGDEYQGDRPEGERRVAAGLRRGASSPRHWSAAPRPVDALDAKADAEAVLAAVGAPVASLQVLPQAPDWYHPGRSGALGLGPGKVLAWFGELNPAVLRAMDVAGPAVGFEVLLDQVPLPKARRNRSRPPFRVSDFPAVERDFAFVVDAGVSAQEVLRAVRMAERTLIAEAGVFDVYQGPGVAEGKKSIAVAVRLEPREKTLTEPEIEAVGQRIVAQVAKATGATLRS